MDLGRGWIFGLGTNFDLGDRFLTLGRGFGGPRDGISYIKRLVLCVIVWSKPGYGSGWDGWEEYFMCFVWFGGVRYCIYVCCNVIGIMYDTVVDIIWIVIASSSVVLYCIVCLCGWV